MILCPTEFMLKGLTCITFDMGDDSFLATHGVWLKHDFVEIEPNCGVAGNCGRFRSANRSSMQVPAFSNAFDQFSEFSVSFWFKRDAGNTGLQALINNYACNVASSVDISSTDADVVAASMRNETGSAVALLDLAVSDAFVNKVVVVALVNVAEVMSVRVVVTLVVIVLAEVTSVHVVVALVELAEMTSVRVVVVVLAPADLAEVTSVRVVVTHVDLADLTSVRVVVTVVDLADVTSIRVVVTVVDLAEVTSILVVVTLVDLTDVTSILVVVTLVDLAEVTSVRVVVTLVDLMDVTSVRLGVTLVDLTEVKLVRGVTIRDTATG